MRSFYQDRLGTNIGKALKNRPFSQDLKLMDATGVPMGISKLGFGREDIPALVAGTLPQVRPLALLCLAHVEHAHTHSQVSFTLADVAAAAAVCVIVTGGWCMRWCRSG
jgi:hypothetical protein